MWQKIKEAEITVNTYTRFEVLSNICQECNKVACACDYDNLLIDINGTCSKSLINNNVDSVCVINNMEVLPEANECVNANKGEIVVYIPPDMKVDWIDAFELEISKASSLDLEIIIMGDINIDYAQGCSNNKWSHMIQCYGLTQLIDNPTRVTDKSKKIIDHIYIQISPII
ncbi:unnamed protein product [Mytilus coruscus]|uniref:Endonuclease/exonuclease/phosphatase domain-containing protein n=1 Tax=Mytilus coruscus TaxID=42192 RepID=A0A6J8CPM2_MYTCO|nr:unnamed protein product [Mytilus coruscus]